MTTTDQSDASPRHERTTVAPEVVVVGGAGHVGLPLSLALAEAGFAVGILDTSSEALAAIANGHSPFDEPGTDELLARFVGTDRFSLSSSVDLVRGAHLVILTIGLADESQWSTTTALDESIDALLPHLEDGTLLVIRNTVYPGTTAHVRERLHAAGRRIDVACCPERMVQGRALAELRLLPQIVGADDEAAASRAAELFRRIGVETVACTTVEAELAKLVTNAWRYISFAAANEFAMLANGAGANYEAVLRAARHGYPRARDLPGPGFAAGPCLPKDAHALATFGAENGVGEGIVRAALHVNDEMPERVVEHMKRRFGELAGRRIGVLGMAFKRGSDDVRGAPSAKVRDLLRAAGADVLCTDPFVSDPANVPLADVLGRSDILVVATPHDEYQELDVAPARLVDVFGITRAGITI